MNKIEDIKYVAEVIPSHNFYANHGKRWLDGTLSAFALVVLSPVFLVLVILEWFFHGRPAFYKTNRPGRDGKIFSIYKFRSMTNQRDVQGRLLPEKDRLTKFGIFLRKTSLDELPQLFNIFKGDMAIIGPRPLLVEYLPLYNNRHGWRHHVRPGLLCLIDGKPGEPITWGKKFESDIYYVEHVSLKTDVNMMFRLFREVFGGAEYRALDTRVPFDGNNLDETRSKEELKVQTHFESLQ